MIDDRILGQHLAIVGRTGSGKTYAAKIMVEKLLRRGRRVCVLDPTGVWWGLRSTTDGTQAGFPVAVFGGEHADVPISASSGAVLAGVIAQRNLPAVVDLSDMLIGDRHHFATDFAEALYRENRQPLYLVIDEADEFAPQNPMPETKRMLHHIDRIVRRGRVRGFRVMLISQRPAVLHKNVLTQANTLIAMRLPAPQDRKAIEAWVDGNGDKAAGKRVLDSLAGLQRGEGWIWCPEHGILERHRFGKIATFDSGRTPEDGEAIAEPAKLADVDLTGLRAAFIEAEKEADANDPKRLRARIAELEAEIRVKRSAVSEPDRQALEREYRRGTSDGYRAGLAVITQAFNHAIASAERAAHVAPAVEPVAKPEIRQPAPALSTSAPPARPHGSGGPELRILRVLAARHPARFTVPQWATLAGMKRTGGTWQTYVSRLRTAGYIETRDGLVGVTPAGMAAAGPVNRPSDPVAMWKQALGSGPARMLDIIIERPGIGRQELADAMDMTASGGTFQTYLSRLRSNGLIEQSGGGLRAAEVLWR